MISLVNFKSGVATQAVNIVVIDNNGTVLDKRQCYNFQCLTTLWEDAKAVSAADGRLGDTAVRILYDDIMEHLIGDKRMGLSK